MDACTELQWQSVPFAKIEATQKDLHVDMSTKNNESIGSTHDNSLIQKVLFDEPERPNLLRSPTSTPKEVTVYPNTPQTSPPQPTPLKVTLSNTEIANIVHTSSIMSSLTSDSIPASSYQLPFSASETCAQLSNGNSGSETKRDTETIQALKETTQHLMSPVKLLLKPSCSMNDIPKPKIPEPHSLKRHRDDEIARIWGSERNMENDSVRFLDSPKKARIVEERPMTPKTGNRRFPKVSRPFRPPSSRKSEGSLTDAAIISNSPKTPVNTLITPEPKKASTYNQSSSNKLHSKTYHTLAVSKPFKSPFKSPLSSLSSATNKSASSPNIQALEKKVTMLRRAIKLTADKEDEKLKDLVQKWTLAGREVSWELWSVMKERGPGDAMAWSEGSRFEDSWSWGANRNWWSEERTEEGSKGEENSASLPIEAEMWNSINIQNTMKRQEAEANKVSPHTLGAMLRSYGITNDILGWNDDEEDFDQL